MDAYSKFTLPGILLLLTLVFGFWLSSAGKPYHGLLFNLHKFIALGAVVMAVIQFAKTFKTHDPRAAILALLVLAALCVLALFTSGALMSLGRLDYRLTLTIHRIAPLILTLALALAIDWLGR